MSNIKKINDSNFDTEVLGSDKPVLVDFSAEWCGPCKVQMPIVEKLAQEEIDTLKVVTVDTDDCPQITSRLKIKNVPSIMLFNKGKKVDSVIGLTSLEKLHALIAQIK